MNSYGDGNTYRGTVCKDSEVPTIVITDGKAVYRAKITLCIAMGHGVLRAKT